MNRVQLLLEVTRARTLPVMAAPVIIGSVLAWQQGATFHWGSFVLALVGALAAHLGANVINDIFDFGAGVDQAAQAIMPQGNTVVALGEKGARIIGAIILLLICGICRIGCVP